MTLKKIIRALFPALVKIPPATRQVEPGRTRRIVASLARGNLNLRLGRYMTADQLEERKLSLARHRF